MNVIQPLAQLQQVIAHARAHSPFYRELYASLPTHNLQMTDLPVLDSKQFWAANSVQNNRLLTAPLTEGVTFKSGGTTGQPKYSVFTNTEWEQFTRAFGQGMRRGGLQPGDRIGNLFYAGKLYASFLFIGRSIEAAGAGICYPIAGDDLDEILRTWRQFDLNVLAGVPTTLMKLLERLSPEDKAQLKLERFLYGGEPMFADQIAAVQAVFPQCQIHSVGVAGVDYGELGWCSPGSPPGTHHCFDDSTVLEILDAETGQPIEAMDTPGQLVITNLQRRLMPIIRYPVGDRGAWLDPVGTPARRFQLLGRSEEGARIGPMSLYVDDVRQALQALEQSGLALGMQGFQLLITHHAQRDACCLRLAVAEPAKRTAQEAQQVQERIYAVRPMFQDLIDQGLLHALQVQWLRTSELETNPRTGKLMRVIDRRHESP